MLRWPLNDQKPVSIGVIRCLNHSKSRQSHLKWGRQMPPNGATTSLKTPLSGNSVSEHMKPTKTHFRAERRGNSLMAGAWRASFVLLLSLLIFAPSVWADGDPENPDSDGDGLLDSWELLYAPNLDFFQFEQ